MGRILGLDLGTNSIGWAIVETTNNTNFELIDKGVHIFQEGVKIEKGIEGSKAAERTGYRSARRLKFRRKLRKIETLKVLSQNRFCPNISDQELENWRYKKIYPKNEKFRQWLLTDENTDKNPYYFRASVANKKLDLSQYENRYMLGRALYHMAQRRGFLSNRLETTKENDGAVKKSISELSEKIDTYGYETLGQYYNSIYNKEKIRGEYTGRKEHYLHEFNVICAVQELPDKLIADLKKAIFYQRPLKSQKGLVGKCPFETNKPRCAVSRPEFEEFRMLCFINNIKIKTPNDEKLRPLTAEERNTILPRFYLQRDHFDFEDIAKQLAPLKQYKYYKSRDINSEDFLFNYPMKTTVSACPVSARFQSIFGKNWKELSVEYIREKDNTLSSIDIDDVWHVLFTFDSNEKLIEFAKNRLKLNEEELKELLKIKLKQDYGSLSLKAIKKILPYLRQGLIYSHAVFLANMEEVIPADIWKDDNNKRIIRDEIAKIIETQNEEKRIIEVINGMVKTYQKNNWRFNEESEKRFSENIHTNIISVFGEKKWNAFNEDKKERIKINATVLFEKQMHKKGGWGDYSSLTTIDDRVKTFLSEFLGIENEILNKIYHPSAIDVFKKPKKSEIDGKYYLGSPLVSSIRNPMAMRALHQLRKLINELIRQDIIDPSTKINIEMSRDLKNANERKALQSWQRDREKLHKEYAERIKEYFDEFGIEREPSKDDILKYQLWEEQNHICIYTGDQICPSDFLSANPKYDIEHTIPRSVSFDNSQVNKTLCQSKYNREIKRNKIPYELSNHNEILVRVEKWKEKYEQIDILIQQQVKKSRGALTKEVKDNAIQRRHKLTAERNYWRGKYERFAMSEVPSSFKNSQLVDIGIITKYSRMYLNTLFDRVYTVKGSTVADFRKMWGLQEEYEKKARNNHTHHCIDAITIACMSKQNYEALAKYYHDSEEMFYAKTYEKPHVDKPWPTFTQDIKEIEKEIFVSHYTADNLPKQSKKKLRMRGKIQINNSGRPIYKQGDTVRGSLHKETFYGAIKREIVNKKGEKEEKILHVVRKPLDSLSTSDIKNIVDDIVREKVQKAIDAKGLKQALSEPIWMNEEERIPIKKVRCYTPTVTNPIHLKEHQDKSKHAYKQHYHVTNDGNYLMAIYEGKDNKGIIKRDFKIVNNLEASKYFKYSAKRSLSLPDTKNYAGLIPKTKQINGLELSLKFVLKTGMQVIFWNNEPDEIWNLDQYELNLRVYKLAKFDKAGRLYFRHHEQAKQASELREVYVINWNNPCEQLRLTVNTFNAIVEDYDFIINILGKIKKIEK